MHEVYLFTREKQLLTGLNFLTAYHPIICGNIYIGKKKK